MVDARHVGLLIANLSGTAVIRLSHVTGPEARHSGRDERLESLALPGSTYERVLFTQQIEIADLDGGALVLVPVTERGDAIGILELSLDQRPDTETVEYLVDAAHELAYVLIASRRHTDLFEWAQRDIPFSVAAEIQRRLLPSAYTAEIGPLTISGWLEPAHNVGGDTFDYSIDRDHIYVSITDAMGHSVDAALLATLVVGTLRNSRRMLTSTCEQADAANTALLEYAREDQYVTAQLLRISLADGTVEMVNAGHPSPYLLRAGRLVTPDLAIQLPLGVQPIEYTAQSLRLEPGDRLLLLTDGYLERGAVDLDVEKLLARTGDRHPRQIVQELAGRVLAVTGGDLRDDATAVCIDWYGAAGDRDATGGSSHARATRS
jgi:serine phosphatase RsbU (regulator of sigma subunit)